MTTLLALRRAVGRSLLDICEVGTVETGNQWLIEDTDVLKLYDEAVWIGGHVLVPSLATTPRLARVYNFENGQLQLQPTLGADPSGFEYEVWRRFSPDAVMRAANLALETAARLPGRSYFQFTGGQYEYTLPSAVLRVTRVTVPILGGGSVDVNGYQVLGEPGRFILKLEEEGLSVHSAYPEATVCVVHVAAYTALSADDDDTPAPLDWLEYKTAAFLYERFMPRTAKQDRTEILRNIAFYSRKADQLARQYGSFGTPVRQPVRWRVTP